MTKAPPARVSFLFVLSEETTRRLPRSIAARAQGAVPARPDIVLTDASPARRAELRRSHPSAWQVYLTQGAEPASPPRDVDEPSDVNEPSDVGEPRDVDDVWRLDAQLERRVLAAERFVATLHQRLRQGGQAGSPQALAGELERTNPAPKPAPTAEATAPQATGALGTLLDLSVPHDAGEPVRDSEARYRELVQRSPDPIAIIVAGKVAFANRAALDLVGASDPAQVLGKPVFELFEPTRGEILSERAARLLAGESIPLFEERLLRLDGTDAWIELSATTVSFEGKPALFISSRDVTARREAEIKLRRYEAQMQHTQKLESLGILAGGIAHDFNNLLVAIVGNADLARLRLSDTSPALECLDRIQAAAQRATDLTNQMLAYSGKSRFIVTDVDLTALVLEMSDLLGTVISKHTRLHPDLARGLPTVEADPAQLGQVVMNLITNASDSLGGKPGDVYLSTRIVDVDRGFLQQTYLDEGLPEGRYVCLEVRDTGCGMDEATRSRIFDPFFTTKATGRGLGLAATLGIVRGHRGAVRIDTEPGVGTLFRIYLPCSDSPSNPSGRFTVSTPPSALDNIGILIADDEALSLDVSREQLARLGLRVLTALSGQEALELLERSESLVAVALLDVGLRDANGLEVVERILERHPGLKVVLTSGYTADELRERLAAHRAASQIAGFLQKPYTREALKRAVWRALGAE